MNTLRYLESVDNINPSQNEISGTDWQVLGKLELPIGSGADDAIASWLIETLNPLNLHTDFLNKVVKSAQEVAAHTMQSEAVIHFQHVHFLVVATVDQAPERQAWGFFRIGKIGDDELMLDHTIEFFLYQEG